LSNLPKGIGDFFMEKKVVKEEVGRWKEASELEVEARKVEIEERDICKKIL